MHTARNWPNCRQRFLITSISQFPSAKMTLYDVGWDVESSDRYQRGGEWYMTREHRGHTAQGHRGAK